MSHNYCVLLLGIADPVVPRNHFGKAGILVREAVSLTRDFSSLKNPELDVIFLQPSEEARATEELRQILECRPDLPVILISGKPSVHLAREAWHAGAADILFLPLTPESLDESLRHAVRH